MQRLLCGAFLLLIACGNEPAKVAQNGQAPPVERVAFPVADAAVPFVTGDGAGGFAVSYVSGTSFAFTTYREAKWTPPRTISSGNLLVNRADFPSISIDGRSMLASWSTRNEHGSVVHLARSDDGGATWSDARTPHPVKVSQFGFVALAGTDGAVLLDGRKLEGGVEGEGEMELRWSAFPFTRDEPLDARVCDCCQTAVAVTSEGPVVAYRDRSDDEVRDISIVRRTASGWTEPRSLHPDNWKIAGCPVNGPQLDAIGKRVVAAWFTASNNDPRVYAAFSTDAGETFGAPMTIHTGKPSGRADVALLEDGSAVVSWMEPRGEKGMLLARRITPGGRLGAPVEVAAASGFPRIAISMENVGVVWSADERVHFATLDLPRP